MMQSDGGMRLLARHLLPHHTVLLLTRLCACWCILPYAVLLGAGVSTPPVEADECSVDGCGLRSAAGTLLLRHMACR
jgi:hypothetical protein